MFTPSRKIACKLLLHQHIWHRAVMYNCVSGKGQACATTRRSRRQRFENDKLFEFEFTVNE